MRVVFVGASGFGLRCLEAVAGFSACELAGVITAPREFRISYAPSGVTNVLHADFAAWARARGTPCLTIQDGMNDPRVLGFVRARRPDLFVVVGWYHLVPRSLRQIAPAIGLHASLLPDYAGGAPLVWAIINGEPRTGITLFQLSDGVDDGPIYAQAEETIRDEDTIATLYSRIEEHGLALLRDTLPRIAAGTAHAVPQDLNRRRAFPQRSPEDGRIDWSWPARRVYDFVRAQTKPYPGAFAFFRGEKLHIWRARLAGEGGSDGFRVVCGDGQELELEEVGIGPNTMSGCELLVRIGMDSSHAARWLG